MKMCTYVIAMMCRGRLTINAICQTLRVTTSSVRTSNCILTVTRILDLRLTSSRRSPSVSAVTACLEAEYMKTATGDP
jgi:hypothetical protein